MIDEFTASTAQADNELIKPKAPRVEPRSEDGSFSDIIIEPLEQGFGQTLGNALRRTLLSSLHGAAATGIRIDGVLHEFSTVPGVREDVTDIVMNVKALTVRMISGEEKRLTVARTGPGVVTAGDITVPHGIEVSNPDLVICTLDEGAQFRMELTVGIGKGYCDAERNRPEGAPIGLIPVDSIFSPVRQVSFRVENTRVGQDTEYDRLLMTVTTNGSITAQEAVANAARILQDQLQFLVSPSERKIQGAVAETNDLPFPRELLKKVDELELSVRAANCLKNDNIVYIGDLVQKTESNLLRTPNFGRKSLNEIKEVLGEMSFYLGMDVTDWPPDNIEELARRLEEPF